MFAAKKLQGAGGTGGITGDLIASGVVYSDTPVVNFGQTIQAGDLILAGAWHYARVDWSFSSALNTIHYLSTPLWNTNPNFLGYMQSGYRVCNGSEGTSVSIGSYSVNQYAGAAALFRFSEPVTGITYNTWQSSYALNGSPTRSYNLTGAGNNVPQIAWGRDGGYSSGVVPPAQIFSLGGYTSHTTNATTQLTDAWRLTFSDENVTWYSSSTFNSSTYHIRAATIIYPTF